MTTGGWICLILLIGILALPLWALMSHSADLSRKEEENELSRKYRR